MAENSANNNNKDKNKQPEQPDHNLTLSNPGEPGSRKSAVGKAQPIGFSGKLKRIDN